MERILSSVASAASSSRPSPICIDFLTSKYFHQNEKVSINETTRVAVTMYTWHFRVNSLAAGANSRELQLTFTVKHRTLEVWYLLHFLWPSLSYVGQALYNIRESGLRQHVFKEEKKTNVNRYSDCFCELVVEKVTTLRMRCLKTDTLAKIFKQTSHLGT